MAQPRARVTRFGTYDPAKDKKNWYRIQLSEQVDEIIEGPIALEVFFFLPIPKSTTKKKRNAMLLEDLRHTKKPDIDNYIKLILDVMTGIVYKDDSQIWRIDAKKMYSDDPRTEIILTW